MLNDGPPAPTKSLKAWAIVFSVFACLGWPWCAQAAETTLRLDQASVSIQMAGQVPQHMGSVALPYLWDKRHPGEQGVAEFEFEFNADPAQLKPQGLFIPRAGNAFEVILNGYPLLAQGEMNAFNAADYSKTPHWVQFPSQWLQAKNHLVMRIRADALRRAGLDILEISEAQALRNKYEEAYRLQVTPAYFIVGFNLLVFGLAMAFWATSRTSLAGQAMSRDRLYLYAAAAELSWSIRMSDTLWVSPPLSWPWWGIVNSVVYPVWVLAALMFCHRVANVHAPWVEKTTGLILCIAIFSAVGVRLGLPAYFWTLSMGLLAVGALAYGVWFAVITTRQPSMDRMIISASAMANVVAGARDWWVIRVGGDLYGNGHSWIRYTSVLFGLTLLALIVQRFQMAQKKVENAADLLAQRLAERELELQQSFEQQKKLVQQQTRESERMLMIQDMHDGVGAHLSSVVRMMHAKHEPAHWGQIKFTLQDALDQLKLTVDSRNWQSGDLMALLADMRYRMESRLAACGIDLKWQVQELPCVSGLNVRAMQNLQYMLLGLISNVIQHSQATKLTLRAQHLGEHVQIELVDDGVGFDADAPRQRGLALVAARAEKLNALLTITSQPGGTRATIQLPA